jgi:hypothetical protein
MNNTPSKTLTADEIADMADQGEDVSRFFTNTGTLKYPARSVQIDFPTEMAQELEELAQELNISVQAVILSYLRQALDQHYLAKRRLAPIVPQ